MDGKPTPSAPPLVEEKEAVHARGLKELKSHRNKREAGAPHRSGGGGGSSGGGGAAAAAEQRNARRKIAKLLFLVDITGSMECEHRIASQSFILASYYESHRMNR